MKMGYLDDPVEKYCKALVAAKTLDELKAITKEFYEIAADAAAVVDTMTENEFKKFKIALRKERHGKFCGAEAFDRFGPVMVPQVMAEVMEVARKFKVPWGLAFVRMRDVGKLKRENGAYVSVDLTSPG